MKPSRVVCTLATCLALVAASPSEELREDVRTLTSQEFAGRLTGTPGAQRAAHYLVQRLTKLGAQPLPGRDSLLVPFEFSAGARDAGSELTLRAGTRTRRWEKRKHVQALSFSETAAAAAPVVFAGYGIVLPDGQAHAYDSYADIDVRGKIALVLRYFPEDLASDRRTAIARYSGLRYKALVARERGAKALLVVSGPTSPNAGETIPPSLDAALSDSGLPAASISGAVADELFELAGADPLATLQEALDAGEGGGFELVGVEAELAARVARESHSGQNVVGVLPGSAQDFAKPYVVIGAHYDHLGEGDAGNSLARAGERGQIHPGADDNASGVAAVLRVGQELRSLTDRRNIVLALWSGEELGLIGSRDFLASEHLAGAKIAAYLNFDMVGRLRDNRLLIQGTGTSPVWSRLIERHNVAAGFDIRTHLDAYLPTDSASFDRADVPALNFFTGAHRNYHRPSDRADTLDYAGLERVSAFAARIAASVATAKDDPAFVRLPPQLQGTPGRADVRVFTGTIPDYTSTEPGLSLMGVVPGGPAERAGLRPGDVVVEFGGREISNVYDYTYALDGAKAGEVIRVIYVRDGERIETQLTPTARK